MSYSTQFLLIVFVVQQINNQMGGEAQPAQKFVPYFDKMVEIGQRGNVIQEVHFNSRRAEIQYIPPKIEDLRLGIWIGTRPLGKSKFIGLLGFGYNPNFDKLIPQAVHAALLVEGMVAEITDKDKKNGMKVKITLRALTNEVLQQFNWHLILRRPQNQIKVQSLAERYQDYTYSILTNIKQRKINCQSFCVESVQQIYSINETEAYKLIGEGVHQSYNWRNNNLL